MMFNVPSTFVPKPEKLALETGRDIINYHYLIRLPTNKYAYATIYQRTDILKGSANAPTVNVQGKLYELNDMNI